MVDLSFLKQFTKGDPQKIKRYIKLYLDVAPTTMEEMKRHLIQKDWDQLRIKAHSLKPQTDYMGIIELKEEFTKIEEAVKSNDYDRIEVLLQSSFAIATQSEIELRSILEQLE